MGAGYKGGLVLEVIVAESGAEDEADGEAVRDQIMARLEKYAEEIIGEYRSLKGVRSIDLL